MRALVVAVAQSETLALVAMVAVAQVVGRHTVAPQMRAPRVPQTLVAAVVVVVVAQPQARLAQLAVQVLRLSATTDKEYRMGVLPRTFALVEDGVVVNIIYMFAKNLTDFPNAVLASDYPVDIGDEYSDGVFKRDGTPLLSYLELAALIDPPVTL